MQGLHSVHKCVLMCQIGEWYSFVGDTRHSMKGVHSVHKCVLVGHIGEWYSFPFSSFLAQYARFTQCALGGTHTSF